MIIRETAILIDETTMMIWFWVQTFYSMWWGLWMFVIRILNVWIIKYFIAFAHYRIYLYICNSNHHYRNLHYYLCVSRWECCLGGYVIWYYSAVCVIFCRKWVKSRVCGRIWYTIFCRVCGLYNFYATGNRRHFLLSV